MIKDLLNKTNATFVILQETKLADNDRQFIKSIWSSRNIAWASLDAINKVGDILILCNDPSTQVDEVIEGSHFLSWMVFLIG